MTYKQLHYAVTVAEEGNMTAAAKKLFIAQPSLTSAIRELENEYGITIFSRSNKGIELTPEGEEFLGYARQILDQTQLIEERYLGSNQGKLKFFVSGQHYSFAVEAFVELLKRSGADKYEFHMRETQTFNIIDDVAHLRSEIGILYLNKFNEEVILKTLRDNNLSFTPLFRATPHVFIGKNSPLAKKRYLTLEDLKPYPRLSYEQGSHNSFYFSEEILSTVDCDKELVVLDRATLFNLLIGLNGYTICSGVINEELNGPNIIAKKLKVDDYMEIGYILPNSIHPSHLTSEYIEILKSLTKNKTT
ncbi:MAG: LysR family transcriptional regulator [Saccharofermentans sp.]|nr:LysR family transcriptional regulator [Saccharofermentans sp.]